MSQQSRPILIRNGRVIDPSQGVDTVGDVVLVDGVVGGIESCGATQLSDDWTEFDASGMIVVPGFIDLHTHLRTPAKNGRKTPRLHLTQRFVAASPPFARCLTPIRRKTTRRC